MSFNSKRDSYHAYSYSEDSTFNRLYALAKSKSQPRSSIDIEYENQKEECTFKPNMFYAEDKIGKKI